MNRTASNHTTVSSVIQAKKTHHSCGSLDSLCPTSPSTLIRNMNADLSIQRLQAVARRQHKALSTEETYVYWLRRYMAALPGYPATLTSEKKVERFLSDLVRHRDISASSQNQAFNAILRAPYLGEVPVTPNRRAGLNGRPRVGS
jgi:hypothetical protein